VGPQKKRQLFLEAFTFCRGFFVFGREVYPLEAGALVGPKLKSSLHVKRELFLFPTLT